MKVIPLPHSCFDNRIFKGDVVKFNTVAKAALRVFGAIALASSIAASPYFSATLLPVALGGAPFLICLLAARFLVFHDKQRDEEWDLLLATVNAEHCHKLGTLFFDKNYTPGLSPIGRANKAWEYFNGACSSHNSSTRTAAAWHLGNLYFFNGELISPGISDQQRMELAEKYYLKATESPDEPVQWDAHFSLTTLYQSKFSHLLGDRTNELELHTQACKSQTGTEDNFAEDRRFGLSVIEKLREFPNMTPFQIKTFALLQENFSSRRKFHPSDMRTLAFLCDHLLKNFVQTQTSSSPGWTNFNLKDPVEEEEGPIHDGDVQTLKNIAEALNPRAYMYELQESLQTLATQLQTAFGSWTPEWHADVADLSYKFLEARLEGETSTRATLFKEIDRETLVSLRNRDLRENFTLLCSFCSDTYPLEAQQLHSCLVEKIQSN